MSTSPRFRPSPTTKDHAEGFHPQDGHGITAAARRYLQPLIEGEAYPPYGRNGQAGLRWLKHAALAASRRPGRLGTTGSHPPIAPPATFKPSRRYNHTRPGYHEKLLLVAGACLLLVAFAAVGTQQDRPGQDAANGLRQWLWRLGDAGTLRRTARYGRRGRGTRPGDWYRPTSTCIACPPPSPHGPDDDPAIEWAVVVSGAARYSVAEHDTGAGHCNRRRSVFAGDGQLRATSARGQMVAAMEVRKLDEPQHPIFSHPGLDGGIGRYLGAFKQGTP